MDKLLKDVNIKSIKRLLTPKQIKDLLPNTATNISFVDQSRQTDRKSTRLNSSHSQQSRMPSSA